MIQTLDRKGAYSRLGNTSAERALPRLSWLAALAIAEIVLALLLGGGTLQGLWSDAIVQLASLPLLVIAINELLVRELPRGARWPLAFIGVALLLPILQLIPLPPFIWTHLPGRGRFVASFHDAGMALPWAAISLDPVATQRSLVSLLPAISVFLAALSLGTKTKRLIIFLVVVFAVVSVLLGLAQLSGGPDSALRFYRPTNPDDSVGFFANRNHYAALLYCAVPLTVAWWFTRPADHRLSRGFGAILILLAYLFIILGLGMAHSRSGIMLGFLAGLASLFISFGLKHRIAEKSRRRKALLAIAFANLVGLLLAFQFGFVGTANRFNNQFLEDLRWPIAEVTLKATAANLPLGVGFGAFEPVYQMFETRPVVVKPYVNHAHNDWLELSLNGGLPAIVAELAFLIWYIFASLRVWRIETHVNRPLDGVLGCAGSIVVGTLLVHSGLDYPLRTTTMMVVFALGCALMIPSAEFSKK